MLEAIEHLIDGAAGLLDQDVFLPLLYRFGWMRWEELSFDWAVIAVYGLISVLLTMAVCWPLERLRPIERWKDHDAVVWDIAYTLVARAGVLPIASFIVFYQVQTDLNQYLALRGYTPPTLERAVPALIGHPLACFCLYAFILDGADYWRHRLSHRFRRWYYLHAVHHAQRQLTFWSDDRNHVLDDLITALWFGAIALLMGVPPLQFPLLGMALRFIESLSHANANLSYGWLGERLIVSPRFHRFHHSPEAGGRRSCNYAAVFPFWDMLFRTAHFSEPYRPTGDAFAPEAMATGSWFAQQCAGFRLFFHRGRPDAAVPPRDSASR